MPDDRMATHSKTIDLATSTNLGWHRIDAAAEAATAGYVDPTFVQGIEIHIQLSGKSTVWWTEGGPYTASVAAPGKTIILRERSYSDRIWASDVQYLRLTIPRAFVDEDDALAETVDPGHWVIPNDPFHSLATLICAEMRAPTLHGDLIVETLVGSILGNSQTPHTSNHRFSPAQLRDVIEYLIEENEQVIRVIKLARLAGMSPYAFSRAFKEATGYSPYEFVLRMRVERSKSLLTDRRNTGAFVAAAMGYHDESHFSRSFKRVTGVTPSEWRKQVTRAN